MSEQKLLNETLLWLGESGLNESLETSEMTSIDKLFTDRGYPFKASDLNWTAKEYKGHTIFNGSLDFDYKVKDPFLAKMYSKGLKFKTFISKSFSVAQDLYIIDVGVGVYYGNYKINEYSLSVESKDSGKTWK